MQWATALRVPTSDGAAWFKACLPELGVRDRRARVARGAPGRPRPRRRRGRSRASLAAARRRRRSPARARGAPGQIERWAIALRALCRAPAVRRRRTPTPSRPRRRSTAAEPLLFEQFVELLDHDNGLEAEEVGRASRAPPDTQADAERLAALGVPDSIQHDDLHDHNIFIRSDEHRIIDWGDSCVAHPFHSLAVGARGRRARLGADRSTGAQRLRRPWSVSPSTEQLDAAFRLGYVSGTLKWHEVRNLVPTLRVNASTTRLPLRLRKRARAVRLNAYLARAGVASRRSADELIKAGRVTVNGAPGQLNTFVEQADRVEVDGRAVAPQRLAYVLLHKPARRRDDGARPAAGARPSSTSCATRRASSRSGASTPTRPAHSC